MGGAEIEMGALEDVIRLSKIPMYSFLLQVWYMAVRHCQTELYGAAQSGIQQLHRIVVSCKCVDDFDWMTGRFCNTVELNAPRNSSGLAKGTVLYTLPLPVSTCPVVSLTSRQLWKVWKKVKYKPELKPLFSSTINSFQAPQFKKHYEL